MTRSKNFGIHEKAIISVVLLEIRKRDMHGRAMLGDVREGPLPAGHSYLPPGGESAVIRSFWVALKNPPNLGLNIKDFEKKVK